MTGRKHKSLANLPTVTEAEAVEQALQSVIRDSNYANRRFRALLSLGSENFIAYELSGAGTITAGAKSWGPYPVSWANRQGGSEVLYGSDSQAKNKRQGQAMVGVHIP